MNLTPEMPEDSLLRLPDAEYGDVRAGIIDLLQTARAAMARSINAAMTATYWEIGRRVVESEMRGEKRADYGEQLVERLALEPVNAGTKHLEAVNDFS